jgi:hypothetical protein
VVRGLDPGGVVRRCPTLPHPSGCSTIGAAGLSFRVRDGTGRFPHAMTAVTLVPDPVRRWGVPAVGRCTGWVSHCGCPPVVGGIQLRFPVPAARATGGLLVGSRIVDAVFCGDPTGVPNTCWGWGCGVSCRLISTGRLHTSLVRASTSGLSTQWSSWGPLTPNGVWKSHLEASFPLRCFQRLSLPNVAKQRCTWRYNCHTRGSSVPVLSY